MTLLQKMKDEILAKGLSFENSDDCLYFAFKYCSAESNNTPMQEVNTLGALLWAHINPPVLFKAECDAVIASLRSAHNPEAALITLINAVVNHCTNNTPNTATTAPLLSAPAPLPQIVLPIPTPPPMVAPSTPVTTEQVDTSALMTGLDGNPVNVVDMPAPAYIPSAPSNSMFVEDSLRKQGISASELND